MEPISTMTLPGCYKATVNEPETITDAQRNCWFRNLSETNEPFLGFRLPLLPTLERS
jgi:hypothetical protein